MAIRPSFAPLSHLPVVAPLPDGDGRTLFHPGPFRLALYPRVGGRSPELDDRPLSY